MITLELPPKEQKLIEQASRKVGMTIEQYIISKTLADEASDDAITSPKRKLGFMKGEITVPDDIHWGDDCVLAEFGDYL